MNVIEQVEAYTAAVAWSAIGLLAVLMLVLFLRFAWQSAQDNRRVEVEFAETLAAVRELAEMASHLRDPSAVASHRARWQLPDWVRTLAAHGRAKEPQGYGPPPPLTVVEEPTVSAWPTSDVNTVRWPSNPVRNPTPVPAASDPLDAALTVGRVLADPSLRDLVRQPTSMEATQQIEPVRAEVVQ